MQFLELALLETFLQKNDLKMISLLEFYSSKNVFFIYKYFKISSELNLNKSIFVSTETMNIY